LATWIAVAACCVPAISAARAEDAKDKPEAADAPPPLVFEKHPDSQPPPTPPDRNPRWAAYAFEMQSRMMKYIEQNRATFGNEFELYVQLWLDPQGRIIRTNQLAPSGRSEIDALVKNNFAAGLVLPPPAKEMPMPVTFRTKQQRQKSNPGD
jgi:hypothetical protein